MSFSHPDHNHDPDSSRRQSEHTRLYNPYQDLNTPIKTLYNIPTSPEYLFSEESVKQRRSWGENLTFYTGTAYLGASVGGGAVGLFSAVKSFEANDTLKLKVNRVLNSSGHSGRVWGNRIGIVGLIYAMTESGIVTATDKDDVWTSVAAGLGTGAVCRAARGLRSAAVAGALGGLAAGAVVAGKQALTKKFNPEFSDSLRSSISKFNEEEDQEDFRESEMASKVGRLFQESNVVRENVWVKPDASKSSKKGLGLGGRKPLGDLSNAAKNHSFSASLNQTSKKTPVGVGVKATGKLRTSPKNRKVLSDISNSAKLQKRNKASKETVVKGKLSVVPEEEPSVVACGIEEEGFLHDHEKCIKTQTRAMDVSEFMKIIAMEDDFPIQFGSPPASARTNRFEPDSPVNYKLRIEEGSWDFEHSSPAGKHDSSPCWSPPSSPESDLSWMDREDDIFNLKLIDSP